jgi:LysM repeat protein
MAPPPARVPVLITGTPAVLLVTVTSISGPTAPAPATPTRTAPAQPTAAPPPTAPAGPAPIPASTPTPTGLTPAQAIHVVEANDTVWGIAQKYGVTVEDILAANQMDRRDVLQIGQKLRIPPKR